MRRTILITAALALTGCGAQMQMAMLGQPLDRDYDIQPQCNELRQLYTRISLNYYAGRVSQRNKDRTDAAFHPTQPVCRASYTYGPREVRYRLEHALPILRQIARGLKPVTSRDTLPIPKALGNSWKAPIGMAHPRTGVYQQYGDVPQ